MLKIDPHPDYPPEEGRYIRGNDFSPVALAIILNCDADKIPAELERLVRAGLESGCCAGCAVPVGLFKAMQVAAGLALPRDIDIKLTIG